MFSLFLPSRSPFLLQADRSIWLEGGTGPAPVIFIANNGKDVMAFRGKHVYVADDVSLV